MRPERGRSLAVALLASTLLSLAGCTHAPEAPPNKFPDAYLATSYPIPHDLRLATPDDAIARLWLLARPGTAATNPMPLGLPSPSGGTVRGYIAILQSRTLNATGVYSTAIAYDSVASATVAAQPDPAPGHHHGKCGYDTGASTILQDGPYVATVQAVVGEQVAVDAMDADASAIAAAIQHATGATVTCTQSEPPVPPCTASTVASCRAGSASLSIGTDRRASLGVPLPRLDRCLTPADWAVDVNATGATAMLREVDRGQVLWINATGPARVQLFLPLGGHPVCTSDPGHLWSIRPDPPPGNITVDLATQATRVDIGFGESSPSCQAHQEFIGVALPGWSDVPAYDPSQPSC